MYSLTSHLTIAPAASAPLPGWCRPVWQHLPCASSALPGLHTVPHTPILTFCASPPELPFLRSYLHLTQLLSLSFLSTGFGHPRFMAVPYFLTLDCITIIIFPYNICIMIPYELLPQRPLRVKNTPDAIFSGSVRANIQC